MSLYTALCEVKDIEAYFVNKTFNGETSPTITEVKGWINEATSLIYSAVAEQYILPVTDENDLLILKTMCISYVRDNVNYVFGGNKVTIVEKGISIPRQVNHANFWKLLDQIKKGEFKLLNTSGAASGVLVRSYNVEAAVESVSKKDEIQW